MKSIRSEALWTREFLGLSLSNFLIYVTQYAMIAALPIIIMTEYGGGDVDGQGAEYGVAILDDGGVVQVGEVVVNVPFALGFDPVDGALVARDEPGTAAVGSGG